MDKKTLKEKLKSAELKFDDLKQVSGGWYKEDLSPEELAEYERLIHAWVDAPEHSPIEDAALDALNAFDEAMNAKYGR